MKMDKPSKIHTQVMVSGSMILKFEYISKLLLSKHNKLNTAFFSIHDNFRSFFLSDGSLEEVWGPLDTLFQKTVHPSH